MHFKPAFIKKYELLTDFQTYKASVSKHFARKSIRINTLHHTAHTVKQSLKKDGWNLTSVPWCRDGFYIEHETGRRDIGRSKQHKEGMIFSQGSPSMLPALLLKPTQRSTVLDLCAAPGGKTHHLACLMRNNGTIISNEPNSFRKRILQINLKRCGVNNVMITQQRAEHYESGQLFDNILLDVPCTGSGLIKGNIARSKKLLKEWNPKITKRYAKLQQKMLENAWTLLKPKGTLAYATCSLEPEEDEMVIDTFLHNHKDATNRTPRSINDHTTKSSHKKYIKIWPQYYDTNGFFVALLQKK